jgi:hypothetical protein
VGEEGVCGTLHYPRVAKIVEKNMERIPEIKNLEDQYSTFHMTAFAAIA